MLLQLESNKIIKVQFRLANQIYNLIKLNGNRLQKVYPLPLSEAQRDDPKLELAQQCMLQLELMNEFQQNLNNNLNSIQNEREI